MKKVYFQVFFECGNIAVMIIAAFSPLEAAILAQAANIERGFSFKISNIKNEETDQVYRILHEQEVVEVKE